MKINAVFLLIPTLLAGIGIAFAICIFYLVFFFQGKLEIINNFKKGIILPRG